jgi:hypothetical protein
VSRIVLVNSNGYTLHAAIMKANAIPSHATIVLQAVATYTPSLQPVAKNTHQPIKQRPA